MSASEPPPSPYHTDDPPTSSGRTLLATAFAHYCALMWGYSPAEVGQALSDDGDGSFHEHREIRSAARLIGRIVADGRLRTFARPFGGGEPIALKASVWELDDFTARFSSSAIAIARPFDPSAQTTHWVFFETSGFDLIIDAAMADLPHAPRQKIGMAASHAEAGEGSAAGDGRLAGDERLIRLPEVMHRTGMSRSTIYARMGQGRFPNSIPLTGIAAWRESDIREWLNGPR